MSLELCTPLDEVGGPHLADVVRESPVPDVDVAGCPRDES